VSEKETSRSIQGGPTKRFFVEMLVKDIELEDAILDLLDNCIDGAIRSKGEGSDDQDAFKGYTAELTLNDSEFIIADNCGGIPDEHVEDAFQLGRPSIDKDGDLPTIGMYGIGMKRAIFKMGNCSKVESNSESKFFSVKYTNEWLQPDNNTWDLPIEEIASKGSPYGVLVAVSDLKPNISQSFSNDQFLNRLKNRISRYFAYLIQKGFNVLVNGESIKPSLLTLFDETSEDNNSDQVKTFNYQNSLDGVDIKIVVGLFKKLSRQEEIEGELEVPTEDVRAGITVICNDRVILDADRTIKTGWGDGTVPAYHPQFRSIGGLMIFNSSAAELLPISTTKRGVEMDSEIYLRARSVCQEGIKTFTNFTNKWKGLEQDASNHFPDKKMDARTNITSNLTRGTSVRRGPGAGGFRYSPSLPVPVRSGKEVKRISYTKDIADVKSVSEFLFDDSEVNANTVGSKCFDYVKKKASENNER